MSASNLITQAAPMSGMDEICIDGIADEQIIQWVVDGDREAFAHLIERYGSLVSTIVKRHIPPDRIEDVAQEIFITAYQSLSKIKKPNRFKQWISTIAVRRCYEFWRVHYRNAEVTVSSLDDYHRDLLERAMTSNSDDAWNIFGQQEEAREILDWALGHLGPKDRMVVELVHLEELPVRKAAALLGFSVANVKVRAFRSRKKLHKLLLESGLRR